MRSSCELYVAWWVSWVSCPRQGFLEMQFENRPLAAFSVSRNFDRKQTPRSEISHTTRAAVTPGSAAHPDLGVRRYFEHPRRPKNAVWTSNVPWYWTLYRPMPTLFDCQDRYNGGTTQALGLLASGSEKSSKFLRNFDRKQTLLAEKRISENR